MCHAFFILSSVEGHLGCLHVLTIINSTVMNIAAAPQLLQSCPTLCNPMNYSLSNSSVHGIFPARILEWVAMPSSRGSSQPRDWVCVSALQNSNCWATGKPMNTGVHVSFWIIVLSGYVPWSGIPAYSPSFWSNFCSKHTLCFVSAS